MAKGTKTKKKAAEPDVIIEETRVQREEVCRLRGLRRFINVKLAEQDLLHRDAAERAGVSRSRWSHLLAETTMTVESLDLIATGIGMTADDVMDAIGDDDDEEDAA